MKRIIQGGIIFAILALLAACPLPISEEAVSRARDTTPPTINVEAPAEYATYSRLIVITGMVLDSTDTKTEGRVTSLTYEILSHTTPQEAVIASDKSFRIEIPNDLKENIVILLTAIDWKGNTTEYRLPLVYTGNDIPTFNTTEGNRKVMLQWDPVPGVQSYRLYYEASAQTPNPSTSPYVDGISSPYVMSNLSNTKLYSFLLEGTNSDGKKNYSEVKRSIPLSRFDLFPSTYSYFNSIEVTWKNYPGITTYEVFRSTNPGGPYVSVSGPISGSKYKDFSIRQGDTYYYLVKPAQYSTVQSWYVEASSDSFPARNDAFITTLTDSNNPVDAVVSGSYLYVADYNFGLRIYSLENRAFPVRVASISFSGGASALAISNNYAYVLTTGKKLEIVDITDPLAPQKRGSVLITTNADFQGEGVAVLGNLVFIAGFNDGMYVVDASNVSSPVVRISQAGKAAMMQNYSVAVQNRSGTRIVFAGGFNASLLYTVTGPDNAPVLTQQTGALPYAGSGVFSGTTLFIASSWDVAAYNTATLNSPVSLGSVSPLIGVAGTEKLAVSGNRLYVSLTDYGFADIDITIPGSMSVVYLYNAQGSPKGVAIANGFGYITAGQGGGIHVFGLGNTSTISLVSTLSNLTEGSTLTAYRDVLFVGERYQIESAYESYPVLFDIGNPGAVTKRSGTVSPNYSNFAFAPAGDYMILAAERSGATFWNVANLASPQPIGTYVHLLGSYAWSVAISGNVALIGTAGSYLNVLDLSYDNSISVLGSIKTATVVGDTTEIRGIAVQGSLAFLANETAGLRIVDFSSPGFPILLNGYGDLPSGGSAAAVAATESLVLVADSVNGLLIYDISTVRSWTGAQGRIWPASPSGGGAYDVKVRGNYAYVARGAAGLDIWDISNPYNPVKVGNFLAGGFSPIHITLYKKQLYALDGNGKLYVLNLVP